MYRSMSRAHVTGLPYALRGAPRHAQNQSPSTQANRPPPACTTRIGQPAPRLFVGTFYVSAASRPGGTANAPARRGLSGTARHAGGRGASAGAPAARGGGASRNPAREAEVRARNKSFAAWMAAVAMGTLGLAYASVPLYRVFCQVTGFGGTVRRAEDQDNQFLTDLEDVEIVPGRPITVRFNADVSAGVPWRFAPSQTDVVILPGETALAFYKAENKSSEPITGIATYNVAPAKAGLYFNKVQCFCFDEQRLKPGEQLDMPVLFYLDPSLVEDESMTDVHDITLSYTFFRAEDVTPEQLVQAQAEAMGY